MSRCLADPTCGGSAGPGGLCGPHESWRRRGKSYVGQSTGRLDHEGARRLRQYAAKLEQAARQMLEAAGDARRTADWLERGA